jgi:flagellar basal-body rod protein FlgG
MYAALTGNINAMKRLDIISNNLANANTPGFKKDRLAFESLLQQATSGARSSVESDAAPVFSGERFYTDFSAGTIQQTGNTLDLAIEGDGFFHVTTPDGPAFTRQGNFRMDAAGKIVTTDGYALNPDLTIPPNATKITVGSDGTVSALMPGEISPVTVGTIQIVDFQKPYAMKKMGGSLFVPSDPQAVSQPATNVQLSQGSIEGANVNSVSEMVQMIENTRYFEACSKAVKTFDDMAAKAVSDIGKV